MKKLLFIYNPNAGKGKALEQIDNIVKVFEEAGYETDKYETKAPLDGKAKAEECGEKYDRIVCLGGDGTLSEISSGVMNLEKKPLIGYIPAGSTNDTAANLGLSKDFLEDAKTAVTGTPMKIDMGLFNDKSFVYVASFGDLAAVSAFTPRKLKKSLGHAAYLIEGAKTFFKMKVPEITIEYDGDKVIKGKYYLGMITNSKQVGGFAGITGPTVELDDGLHEVMLLKNTKVPHKLIKQVYDAAVKKEDISDNVCIKFKASEIKITSEEDLQWVIDGEDAGKHKVATIKNILRALDVVVKNS